MAARNTVRHARRTAAAIAAVVFGVVALTLSAGFIEWSNWALRETTIHSRMGHIQIARSGYAQAGLANPFRYLLPEGARDLQAIESLPGVVTVAPRLIFSGLVSAGDTTLSFIADGVDANKEAGLDSSVLIVAGAPLRPGDARGIVIGEGLAANLGVKPGDAVVLIANTPSGGVNAADAEVRGVFSTASRAYDDVAIRVPLELAQQLQRVRGAHQWVVLLDRTERTDDAVAQVRAKLAGSKLEIVPWYALADFYNKTVALFDRQLGVLRVVIAAIIVLGITNTLMMSVAERTGEIGTVMALGVTRRRLLGQFLAEGSLLALIGSVAGVALAVALAHVVSAIGIPLPAPPGQSRGYMGRIFVTPPILLEAVLVVCLATLAASAYPAWKASRMMIVDALRHNR